MFGFGSLQIFLCVQEALRVRLPMHDDLYHVKPFRDTLHGALGQLPSTFDGVEG